MARVASPRRDRTTIPCAAVIIREARRARFRNPPTSLPRADACRVGRGRIICALPGGQSGEHGVTNDGMPERERKSAAWWDAFWARPLAARGRALTCRRTAEETLRLLARSLSGCRPADGCASS